MITKWAMKILDGASYNTCIDDKYVLHLRWCSTTRMSSYHEENTWELVTAYVEVRDSISHWQMRRPNNLRDKALSSNQLPNSQWWCGSVQLCESGALCSLAVMDRVSYHPIQKSFHLTQLIRAVGGQFNGRKFRVNSGPSEIPSGIATIES